MMSLINLYLLYKALDYSVDKKIKRLCYGFIVVYALVFISLFNISYVYRYLFVGGCIFIVICLHLIEVLKRIKRDSSIHLKFITVLQGLFMGLVSLRIFNLHEAFNVHYVYEESASGLFVRVVMTLIYFAILLTISSYFYEKLMLSEMKAVSELEFKLIQLEQVTEEKDQIKLLLAEREQLLHSLVKSEKIVETGVLSATIAHELSQPLCAIKINAQSMTRLVRDQKNVLLDDALLRISHNVDRAAETIDALKNIFVGPVIKNENILMDSLIETIGIIFQATVKKKAINVVYDLNAPRAIKVNVSEFQQVFINLLNNAINALDAIDISVKQITVKTEQSATLTRIVVLDNGVGIPEHIGQQIFELMSTTKSTGMGVGLWLSRYIVERHGGVLVYENQSNGGVAFIIELPMIDDINTLGMIA